MMYDGDAAMERGQDAGAQSSALVTQPDVSLRSLIDNLAPRVFAALLDARGCFIYLNRQTVEWSGMGDEEIIGRHFLSVPFWKLSHQSRRQMKNAATSALRGRMRRLDISLVDVRGRERVLDFLFQPVMSAEGKLSHIILTAVDITEHRRTGITLLSTRFALDHLDDLFVQASARGEIMYANASACRVLGRSRDQLLGLTLGNFFEGLSGQDWDAVWHALRQQGALIMTSSVTGVDGESVDHSVKLVCTEVDGEICAFVFARGMLDMSAHANRGVDEGDVITGLPGRDQFVARLEQELSDAAKRRRSVVVMMVALDRFQLLLDILGRASLDRVVAITAERIRTAMGSAGYLSRVSDDEFALFVACDDTNATVKRLRSGLSEALSELFLLRDQELFLTCSMGIAVYPEDSWNSHQLMMQASMALHRAASHGRGGQARYQSAGQDNDKDQFMTEMALHGALRYDEFELHYQPRISAEDGKISGAEALIRWRHPSGELIMPDRFIPLAEKSDLIVKIGEWVVNEACRQFQAWRRDGLWLDRISVNISPRQFREERLVSVITSALSRHGMLPQQLEVELTESMLMEDVEQAVTTMNALKALGVSIALDDFGIGHSCLSHIRRFPFDILKIDKSFIREMVDDENNVAIVEAVIALSHRLGLRVVAEGVEDHRQLSVLKHGGCHEIQGYLFSRPVPVEAMSGLLKKGIKLPVVSAD